MVVAAEDAVMLMARNMATVEKLLNYSFKNPTLLAEALTHSSHPSCGPTYQRLEFMGDAALGLAVSNYLYLTNCQIGPGRLTSLRSGNVNTDKLARVAVKHNLYPLLLRSSRDLDNMVRDFTLAVKAEEDEVIVDAEGGGVGFVYDSPSHGGSIVRAPKVLADVVEAIIGAVYVDCNFNLEEMWVHVRGILEPIVTDEDRLEQPMSKLYEICQKNGKVIDVKSCVSGTKKVVPMGKLLGIGSSKRKRITKLNAARAAVSKLSTEAPDVVANVSNHTDNTNTFKEEKKGKMLTDEDRLEQPVSKLYKICQKNGKAIDVKSCVNGTKKVVPMGKLLGIGSSKRKRITKLNVARAALSKLSAEAPDVVANVSNRTDNTNTSRKKKKGKMLLNEFCSRRRWPKPVYSRVEREGPAHERRYKCSVHIQTSTVPFVASGDFKSRVKDAENDAAYKMYLTLESTIRS